MKFDFSLQEKIYQNSSAELMKNLLVALLQYKGLYIDPNYVQVYKVQNSHSYWKVKFFKFFYPFNQQDAFDQHWEKVSKEIISIFNLVNCTDIANTTDDVLKTSRTYSNIEDWSRNIDPTKECATIKVPGISFFIKSEPTEEIVAYKNQKEKEKNKETNLMSKTFINNNGGTLSAVNVARENQTTVFDIVRQIKKDELIGWRSDSYEYFELPTFQFKNGKIYTIEIDNLSVNPFIEICKVLKDCSNKLKCSFFLNTLNFGPNVLASTMTVERLIKHQEFNKYLYEIILKEAALYAKQNQI